MSSDKISNIQQPVVAVNLALQNADGDKRNRTIEMSKEDLQKLLTSIEAANKVMFIQHLRNAAFPLFYNQFNK